MESVFFFVFSFNFNYILAKKNVFQLTGPHVAVANLGGGLRNELFSVTIILMAIQ